MDFITIFFIALSLVVLFYFIFLIAKGVRIHLFFELFFIFAYGLVVVIFLFPGILSFIEKTLGIQSAINFLVYLSIFVAYFLIFLFYTKTEKQRQEITKLTREIALLNKSSTKKKKK